MKLDCRVESVDLLIRKYPNAQHTIMIPVARNTITWLSSISPVTWKKMERTSLDLTQRLCGGCPYTPSFFYTLVLTSIYDFWNWGEYKSLTYDRLIGRLKRSIGITVKSIPTSNPPLWSLIQLFDTIILFYFIIYSVSSKLF